MSGLSDKLEQTLRKMMTEPNFEIFEHRGLKCMIKRHFQYGSLNGYVGVARDSRFFGKNYDEIDEMLPDLSVHGGITFADYWDEQNDNLWYIGFDCGHAYDYQPMYKLMFQFVKDFPKSPTLDREEQYRDIEYVRTEVRALADQLLGYKRLDEWN